MVFDGECIGRKGQATNAAIIDNTRLSPRIIVMGPLGIDVASVTTVEGVTVR